MVVLHSYVNTVLRTVLNKTDLLELTCDMKYFYYKLLNYTSIVRNHSSKLMRKYFCLLLYRLRLLVIYNWVWHNITKWAYKLSLPEHIDSLCPSSFSRPRILRMEKSVNFCWRKTGAKDGVRIGGLCESSRDFLDCVESSTETTDLK